MLAYFVCGLHVSGQRLWIDDDDVVADAGVVDVDVAAVLFAVVVCEIALGQQNRWHFVLIDRSLF